MADLTLKAGTPAGNPPAGYIKLFIGDDGKLTGRDSTGASVLVLGGSNTGDQTITLTGDVTGSGAGSFAATIAAGAVSNAKQAQMPTLTLKGNASGSAATPSDLTVAQARTLLGAGSGNGLDADTVDGLHAAALQAGDYRNLVTNGCCRVSHRASKSLTTSWQTGPVDLMAVAAGGTVSAGTIVQASGVTSLSKSGYACQIQSATLTGASTVSWRHRIEARNAGSVANGAAMVTARTYHDVGTSVTYTITVNKPTAADNFASVTQIATGTVAVANAVNADLSLSLANLGDCSNGLEIIISAACGAITTKNLYLGDLQLVAGSLALPMMPRPMATETLLVARYLRPCMGLIGKANSATNMQIVLSHPDMRAVPGYEANAAMAFTDAVATDFVQSQASVTTVHDATAHNGRISCGFFTGLTSGTVMIQKGTGGTILASSEL